MIRHKPGDTEGDMVDTNDKKFRSQAERLARLYCELWSTGDVNIVEQIFPPGARHVAGNEVPWGEFITALRKDFPDLSRPLEETYIDGDVMVIRTRMQGTHTGGHGYFDYPPTGTRMDIPAATAFRVKDGLLNGEIWSEYNLQSVEQNIAKGLTTDYLEKLWGDGDEEVLKSHVSSGHVLHLNGESNAVEGRRRLGEFIREQREKWDEGAFRIDDCFAGGDWGEKIAYRWSAAEDSAGSETVTASGTAQLRNGVITEQWLWMS